MKFNIIILFFCLFALTTFSTTTKSPKTLPYANPKEAERNISKKFKGDNYHLTYYKNDYYKICLKLKKNSNILSSNEDCLESFMQTKIKYDCGEKEFEKLKTEDIFKGDTNLILYSKELPFDTILEAMQKSSCTNPIEALDKKYAVPTLSKGDMRVRFMNAIFPSYDNLPKRFYEMGEPVASVNPVGKGLDLSFFIKQFNLSVKLRERSTNPDPNAKMRPNSFIELEDKSGDLKIEKAALYLDKIIPNIYHEVLYLCVRNTQKNKAYHFIVDRAARDPTHEKNTWAAIVLKVWDLSLMSTLVRVTYYSHSNSCDEKETPDSKKFVPNFNLVHIGKDQSKNLKEINDYLSKEKRDDKFMPSQPLMEKVAEEKNSFKKFIVAIQRYALRYPTYNIYNNCQHFATGFFNYLTNQNEEYVNAAKMKELGIEKFNSLRTSKDPFDHFFTDEDDNTFLKENAQRIAANNRRKLKK